MPGMRLFEVLSITWLDLIAIGFLIAAWVGYVMFAAWRRARVPSLQGAMDGFRREWMVRMIERDNRMVDVNVMRNLTRSCQFFASTTMLILGALVALMGYVQQALEVVRELPFTVQASHRLVEIKIVLLVLVFAYAFFKFSWAIRQLGFASILIAAAPKQPVDDPEQYAPQMNRIARIASYAGSNFNNGLRAYYFALAALAWFLHPWLMIAATLWVMLVLYQREFGSKTLKAMVEDDRSPTVHP